MNRQYPIERRPYPGPAPRSPRFMLYIRYKQRRRAGLRGRSPLWKALRALQRFQDVALETDLVMRAFLSVFVKVAPKPKEDS